VWHGLSAVRRRVHARKRIKLRTTIAVLLWRVIEETWRTVKVLRVILAAASINIGAEKGLGHGQLGHEGIGHGMAVRNGGACDKQVAGLPRNVLRIWAPFVQWAIQRP
jgi:hypothetical protein